MTLVVDIDGTLLKSEYKFCKDCHSSKYINIQPVQDEIDLLNIAFKSGHEIILFTSRPWYLYKNTKKELKQFRIKYTELIMGKPAGIWIDKDALKSLKDLKKSIVIT